MKKFFLLTTLLLFGNLCRAESLQFVTTLASPVGTFASLETADPTATVSAPLVNFCNRRISTGLVTLSGANAYIYTMHLQNGATLGGTVPEYRVSGTMQVASGATLEGGRLMANEVTLEDSVMAKSNVTDTLYLDSSEVLGAKADALSIPGQVEASGTGSKENMEWNNSYTCDYEISEGEDNDETTYMVRYNPNTGRFEHPSGIDSGDTCDSNPLVKYTGTPSQTCLDVWLGGSGTTSSMLDMSFGTIHLYQVGDGCDPYTMPCGSYQEVIYPCKANNTYGGGADIRYALSSSNSSLSQSQRWKYYVPKSSQIAKFFGGLKSAYNSWLNNGDWDLGHPYTFNVCLSDASATYQGKGIHYTISYGRTSFRAQRHYPEGSSGGNATCVSDNKYSSYLLKSK